MTIDELELAFDTVSGSMFEVRAYVSRSTGELVFDDEEFSGVECPVEDIEFNEDYICIPDKQELDLGQRLVWKFVGQEIPGLYDKVRQIFSRRGAYGRYKDFLRYNGILEKWFAFENTAVREALLDWCKDNKIRIDD